MIKMTPTNVRPAIGTDLAVDAWYETCGYSEIVTRVKETPELLTVFYERRWHSAVDQAISGPIRTSARSMQKFLCVGGPLNGQRMVRDEVDDGYELYNCASRPARVKRSTTRSLPVKTIFVWKEFLV
jgi:hypothetical protein